MEKRYYWLKLKEDFFDDDTIQYIEEQENGVKYVNFYLKLCLKSIKQEGRLMRLIGEVYMPYDYKALSKLTNADIDTVNSAMMLFQSIGLVTIHESGEIYLNQINEMIGSETDSARRKRESRARLNLVGSDKLVTMSQESHIEKDTNKNKRNYSESFQEFWSCYPRKIDKGNAYKKFCARLTDGFTEEQLISASRMYAKECELNHTDEKYIKHPRTFLSDALPFMDYIETEEATATDEYKDDTWLLE